MTTFAPNRIQSRKLRELDERTRRAWTAYREGLRSLEGEEYDDAERRSWDRLQRKLAEVEGERSELVGSAAVPPANA